MRFATLAAGALLLAGCAAGSPPVPSPTPPATTPASKYTHQFATTFELQNQNLHTVGEQADKVYGVWRYSGKADFLDNTFRTELLVATDFVKGAGTFEGFVTMTSPEGDIGLRITGVASDGPQGPGSAYSGEAEVIGGTQGYDTLAGRGQFTGERTGETGSPVSVEVSLELINSR